MRMPFAQSCVRTCEACGQEIWSGARGHLPSRCILNLRERLTKLEARHQNLHDRHEQLVDAHNDVYELVLVLQGKKPGVPHMTPYAKP